MRSTIETTFTVIQVLVGINIVLLSGVWWLFCTIAERLPQ